MIELPSSLIIGAGSRNSGKTTFLCSILNRFESYRPVAVKVKTLYPGDDRWHGKTEVLEGEYLIREEKATGGMEDSRRMLIAGADKVFYIKSHAPFLGKALSDLTKRVTPGVPLVIESNSARDIIIPGVFLMIRHELYDDLKPSAARLINLADLIIQTNGARHCPAPSEIELMWNDQRWSLTG